MSSRRCHSQSSWTQLFSNRQLFLNRLLWRSVCHSRWPSPDMNLVWKELVPRHQECSAALLLECFVWDLIYLLRTLHYQDWPKDKTLFHLDTSREVSSSSWLLQGTNSSVGAYLLQTCLFWFLLPLLAGSLTRRKARQARKVRSR